MDECGAGVAESALESGAETFRCRPLGRHAEGRGESDEVIGEFNRKFTILDRYVLDLKADGARSMDRRVALALGVMLDTGERR